MTEIPIDLCNKKSLSQVRIARVSTVSFFVATQLKSQIFSIADEAARVCVICSDGPELVDFQKKTNISCRPIPISRGMSPAKDLVSLIRLYLFFRFEKTNIAHSTTPKAGLITAIAAFLARVPIRLHTFTGQPWVHMTGLKRFLLMFSEIVICRLNTRCYADSPSQRDFLLAQGVAKRGQIYVLGSGSLAGVDIFRFNRNRFDGDVQRNCRNELGIPEHGLVVIFLGRITKDKGVLDLLRAFQNLKRRGDNAHLLFVGPFDADSGIDGAVNIADLTAIPDVHWVGYTTCPEKYLAISDILCLPSYREGFGTSVVEAAAMSIPTIGTSIYGLSDAVEHGVTGILVAPGDVNALSIALEGLLNDTPLRVRMGAAARERAVRVFDSRRVNRSLIVEYVQLIGSVRRLIP